jgi:flagellar basal body-associated protein FliL
MNNNKTNHIDKNQVLYIVVAVVLLLALVLLTAVVSRSERQAQPAETAAPEQTEAPLPTLPPEETQEPEIEVPAITPPAATAASGSDIVLVTARPVTDTDIDDSSAD